jgi:hypothetical protein
MSVHERLPNLWTAFSTDPQVSTHVLTVEAVRNLKDFTAITNSIQEQMTKISSLMDTATRDLQAMQSGKSKNPKKAVRSAARSLEKMLSGVEAFNYELSAAVLDMDESFSVAMSSFQRAAQIVLATDEMDKDGIEAARSGMTELSDSLGSMKEIVHDTGNTWVQSFDTGDRFIGAARTFKAITIDYEEFLQRAMETIIEVQKATQSE